MHVLVFHLKCNKKCGAYKSVASSGTEQAELYYIINLYYYYIIP